MLFSFLRHRPLRILLTNIQLNGRTGTEIVIRDLALGLRAAGCAPVVYSPNLGCVADEIAKEGIPVVSSLEDVKSAPDVIHGHHHVETLAALHRFPGVPGIFVCHDATSWFDFPPVHPLLRAYVAVDFNCRERLMREALLKEEEVCVIGNAVGLERFQPRLPLPEKPARAALFSNYAKPGDAWLEAVRSACDAENISFEVIGAGVGRLCERPETILGGFDLVFGKARCVIEALATGCAAIMCDFRGLGEMVTPENVENALNWNCGARLLTREPDQDGLLAEIRRYNPVATRTVSDLVRERRSLDKAVQAYCALYEAVRFPSKEIRALASRWKQRTQFQLIERKKVEECALASGASRQPAMRRMEPSDVMDIDLKLVRDSDPIQVSVGKSIFLDVVLRNESRLTLSSGGHLPVAFCHHWRCGNTREMLIYENARTPLARPVASGTESPFTLTITAPLKSGFYLLELTLVQEWVLWFDGLTPDFPVTVHVVVHQTSC